MVTRVGVLTTRLRLSNSHTLSTCSAPVRFLKGPKTTKTGRRQDAAQKKPAGAMDGPAGVKSVAGTGTEQTRFHSRKQGVESVCDAQCDEISANRIELLTRTVILVAGMNLPEADRATGMSRLLAAVGKEAQRAGRDLDRAETLALISGLTE